MAHDRSWRTIIIASALGIALPITALAVAGASSATVASAPGIAAAVPMASVLPAATAVPSTLPATISPSAVPSTLPATLSPSAVPSTLPATISPRPTVRPSTLPATLSPEEVAALDKSTSGQRYTVTFAARWCPEYSSVFANRARNNIMESLQDLGPDTNYSGGEAISPGKEDQSPQSACTPLVDWNFQLGTGIDGRTPGTNLSRVANPGPVVSTTSSVNELSPAGNVTGRSIAGAVTLELTAQQVQDAANHRLWVQGGTSTQPLGPNAGQYGFASLRCANDNLNGDNVEFVNFTTSQRHVFCYTYLVKPPPKAGVIVIKKAVPDLTAPDISFNFGGNVSFNPGGAFSLRKGQSQEFVRGASADTGFDWRVTEDVPADWQLGISCTSAKGTSKTARVGTNGVDITLAAGDTVTCTFTNSPNPPPNRIELGKFAKGAGGTFGFTVKGPKGNIIDLGSVTVGEDALARIGTYDLTQAGKYTVTETLPVTANGVWELTAVRCEGADGAVVDDRTATIFVADPSARGVGCVLVNTFTSNAASLTIRSTTVGAAGRDTTYEIKAKLDPTNGPEGVRIQEADNTEADVPVTATPLTPADATTRLDPGTYEVQGFGPIATAEGAWKLTSVTCAGASARALDVPNGTVSVNLPPRAQVVCDYVWSQVRPVTLDVTKAEVLSGGQRTSNVTIVVLCKDDATGSLTVRPQDPLPASMTPTMRFVKSTVCRVTETASGGNPVDTTWRLTGPEGTTTGTGTIVDVRVNQEDNPGGAYAVLFTNTYRAGTPTTPPTTPPPTEPPTGGGELPQLPVDPPTLPGVIDPELPTVVLPGVVDTNAGNAAKATVVCSPLNRAASARLPMGDYRLCEIKRDSSGRVTVRVLARPVRVTLTLTAPATDEYDAFRQTRSWVVR